MSSKQGSPANRGHLWIGLGTALLGVLLAIGASQIGGAAGYGGAGPAFLPWLVSLVLIGLGLLQAAVALRSGEELVEAPAFDPRWKAVAWVSVGVLLNALLIERIGFIPSCALLFALAARGFRLGADGRPGLGTLGSGLHHRPGDLRPGVLGLHQGARPDAAGLGQGRLDLTT
jgi:putative tricarboxylic transport membrane protein